MGDADIQPLPTRQPRARTPGRHRRPAPPTLPPNPPALVLAVPAEASPQVAAAVQELLAVVGVGCPGAEVRAGYLHGEPALASVLTGAEVAVVPLVLHADPAVDAEVRRIVSEAGATAVYAEPLGPHPLIAEMLHERLAEAGLARADRVRQMSVSSTGADGIVVATTGGRAAVEAASATAVLLAARLAMQVLPAALPASGEAASDRVQTVTDAVERLRATGARRPAVVPCVVGLDPAAGEIAAAADKAGCPCAEPLGPHYRVAELIALRYREAIGAAGTREPHDPAE